MMRTQNNERMTEKNVLQFRKESFGPTYCYHRYDCAIDKECVTVNEKWREILELNLNGINIWYSFRN